MISIIRQFLDFSGKDNKKKFIISIWLGLLNAFGNALKIPAIMVILYGLLNGYDMPHYILMSVLLMILSLCISILTKMHISVLDTEAGYGCCAHKRIEMAEHMRFVPMGWFNKNTIGEISSIMTNTMDSLSNIATRVIMVTTEGILETIMVIAFLFYFDIRIGFISLCGLAVFLCIHALSQKSGKKHSHSKDVADTTMVSRITEFLKGISVIKSYGLYGSFYKAFNEANEACQKANTDMELSYEPWFFLQNAVLRITSAIIIAASAIFYINGTMDLLTASGMIISSFMLFSGLETFGSFSALLHLIKEYMEKAENVLNLPTMNIDGKDIHPSTETITFEDVDFAYDTKQVIHDISLIIPEKKVTAIVGPSGSGKTTLAHLAARFWDVDHGYVRLDQNNVKDYNFDSLMNNYSFVFQDVYLFHDTIENNIRLARPEASHEEVVKAAKAACCDTFIQKLPEGYNTVIGEGGSTLSGGEKQRLSIARALMKDAPVIILDEATANIDPENEEDLMKALHVLTENKTVIMIAHRLKTVRNADNIVVMDQGRIVAQGKHEELMHTCDLYQRLIEARKHAVNWQVH